MDIDTIRRIAGVARIGLTDEELRIFKEEINGVLNILNVLNNAPKNDSFCFDPSGVSDILREDVPIVDDTADEMLGSMNTYDGFVRGPKVA